MSRIFPSQARAYAGIALFALVVIGAMAVGGVSYYATPAYTRVGYAPPQPVSFPHKLHAGDLGMDCMYCHSHVGRSPHANVPSAQVCINCHGPERGNIKPASPQLAPLREAWDSGRPVPWVRVHKVPDYAYFNHAVHVARGVSCVSCHGRVDQMDTVIHHAPLSMSWCLSCHRNPDEALRPAEEVTHLAWPGADLQTQRRWAGKLIEDARIQPPENCSGCHR